MKFELKNSGGSDTAFHISVLVDDKEVGILYLNEIELEYLIKIMKFGSRDMENISFINSAYTDSDTYEDLDS